MKRYYSHFTFIYPDICLRNYVVEVSDEQKITDIFPFKEEIEKTEFYSGLLIFLPENIPFEIKLLDKIKSMDFSSIHSHQWEDVRYLIYTEDII